MSDQATPPDGSGGEADSGPDVTAEEQHEAAIMRKVMRMQERHREGGIDPDLDDTDADAGPGA